MKTLFVALIFFLLGAGTVYFYSSPHLQKQYQKMMNEALNAHENPSITPTMQEVEGVTPTEVPTGSIEGKLGFPSEGIPELEVYAVDMADKTKFYKINTAKNAQTFLFEHVLPGTYYVIAYTKTNSNYAGGYTKAVPCGLSVSCTNHAFIPVVVKANEVTTGVEPRDWYVPEGTFPSKPK